jgi:hypothetical protein
MRRSKRWLGTLLKTAFTTSSDCQPRPAGTWSRFSMPVYCGPLRCAIPPCVSRKRPGCTFQNGRIRSGGSDAKPGEPQKTEPGEDRAFDGAGPTPFPGSSGQGLRETHCSHTNDPKDRHVVATAVRANGQVIVTSNLKDFPPSSLAEWGIEARHPDQFLVDLYGLDPETVASRLRDQAATIGRSLPDLPTTLRVGVPNFAVMINSKERGGS